MKLYKLERDGEVHYFSKQIYIADFLKCNQGNLRYYIRSGKIKDWNICECYDNVMTNEVDKNI